MKFISDSRVKFPKILLIGDGHGFEAAQRGLLKAKYPVYFLQSPTDKAKSLVEIENWLERYDGVVVSSAFRFKIPVNLVRSHTFINTHYALFPKYRGLHSIVWAMLNNEKNVGVTFHIMNEIFDAGPLLHQKKIKVDNKTSWQLMLECDSYVEKNLPIILKKFFAGKIRIKDQNEKKAFYVGKRNRFDCAVNWQTWSSEYFELAMRALVTPYPRPYLTFGNNEYEIITAKVHYINYQEIPGHVVHIDTESIWVKLVDGLVQIFELQKSSGQNIPANSIITNTGTRL